MPMMVQIIGRTLARTLALAVLLMLSATAAAAQVARGTEAIKQIEFEPGKRTAVVKGTVSPGGGEGDMYNDGKDRYTLNVKSRRTVKMRLVSDNDRARFSISNTPQDVPVKNSAIVTKWSGRLPKRGDYGITIFTTGEGAHYTLEVSVY
jgi:hypothetical protein